MAPPIERASVAVLLDRGRVLVQIRNKDKGIRVGLPGGRADPGENAVQTMCRELYEEAGLVADEWAPFFAGPDGNKLTTAFLVTRWHGQLRNSTEGVMAWADPEVLLGEMARFRDWNIRMMRALRSTLSG